jgi:hypothetical protein
MQRLDWWLCPKTESQAAFVGLRRIESRWGFPDPGSREGIDTLANARGFYYRLLQSLNNPAD